jgi:predicted O-methyltransferase YrrM
VVHDLTPSGIVIPLDKKLKKIFCLTEWHVEHFTNIFPSLKDITVPFYYGIDVEHFKSNVSKQPYKFIYSSFPNRGLLSLLQMWPKIYEYQPFASLHIYCDVDGKWVNEVQGEMMNQIRQLMIEYEVKENGMNIYYYGWVNKQVLAEAWSTASIWFYPCTFMETFCLTALEAALTKTLVITNHLAALQNTVGDRGVIIEGNPLDKEWQEKAIVQIKPYLLPEKTLQNEFINRNFEWASKLSWASQSKKLLDDYILQEKLEYKGMYNWTNDLEKEPFLKTIQYFNDHYVKHQEIRVLEIGVYTGISLIHIVSHIPNSIGYGIDMWSSYYENNLLENMNDLKIEESFYKNIKISGLEDRITGIKMKSTIALLNYIRTKETFDFIYVDGSHLLLDCYCDLVLSWEILEKNGILAIDDYYYKNDTILESPFEAVNHFLKEYEHQYHLLYKGYRVFIQKV